MATDDGAARVETGDLTPDRAIRTIAALHDAMQAARVPRAGERADTEAAERLAWLLIQGYNHLLALAVGADDRHATRIRFDVIASLDSHESAIAEIGIRRNGEGGLTLWANELASALAERPVSALKILRNAAGACASLIAYVCRALAGLGGTGYHRDPAALAPAKAPSAASGAAVASGAQTQPGTARVWVPEAKPTIRVATLQTGPYGVNGKDGPPTPGSDRPEFYA